MAEEDKPGSLLAEAMRMKRCCCCLSLDRGTRTIGTTFFVITLGKNLCRVC
jgi:hypothetical protein